MTIFVFLVGAIVTAVIIGAGVKSVYQFTMRRVNRDQVTDREENKETDDVQR